MANSPPLPQPHGIEQLLRRLVGTGALPALQPQRQGDILAHRQMRQDMKSLKDKAEFVAPQTGQGVLIQPGVSDTVQDKPTAVGSIQTGNQIEQRRFTHPGFTDNRYVFAGLQAQRNLLQDGPAVELARQTLDFKHG